MNETREWYEDFYSSRPDGISPWYKDIGAFLSQRKNWHAPIVELGCGKGELLDYLVDSGTASKEQVRGIEQSAQAIGGVRQRLSGVVQGDITATLPYGNGSVGVVVLAEVIEHLPEPRRVIGEVRRILTDQGLFIVSFPNYLNLPWLLLRIAAQILRKPSWIILQPIDHIFFYPTLTKWIESLGFKVHTVTGSVFFPPGLYRNEPRWFTRIMRRLGLACLAFHPVVVFKKSTRGI